LPICGRLHFWNSEVQAVAPPRCSVKEMLERILFLCN
jgi:hypothetical protein